MESGLPGFGRGFTCPVLIGIPVGLSGFRLRGSHPLRPAFPCRSPNPRNTVSRSRNPRGQAPWFGLLRFRSPLLAQSLLISSPSGTEMFHFPECRPVRTIEFIRRYHMRGGFPHSEIAGSVLVDSSPTLIAVCRVLHRLAMPRHPSCARIRLARNFSLLVTLQFSWFPNFRFSKIHRWCRCGGPDKSRTCDLVLIRDAL